MCGAILAVATVSTRETLQRAYEDEKASDSSRRILLVLRVRYDGAGQSRVARALLRHKSWATKWLRRFEKEGIDDLKKFLARYYRTKRFHLDMRRFLLTKRGLRS